MTTGIKISGLTSVANNTLSDIFVVVQSGVTDKCTAQQLLNLFSQGTSLIQWNIINSTASSMAGGNGYIANNAGLVTLTLPSTIAVGTEIHVQGLGAGGWTIAQNAGQNIQIGATSSTVGVGGSVSSSNRYNSVRLLCVVANTTMIAVGAPQGILTIV